MTDLKELIERVEKATGADRELEAAAETPLNDMLGDLAHELVEHKWRLKAEAPDGWASHSCGRALSEEVGRVIIAYLAILPAELVAVEAGLVADLTAHANAEKETEAAEAEVTRLRQRVEEAMAIIERMVAARTTVRGTEMDAVLGPEYRLHGIHFNKAEDFLCRARKEPNNV